MGYLQDLGYWGQQPHLPSGPAAVDIMDENTELAADVPSPEKPDVTQLPTATVAEANALATRRAQ